MRTGVLAAALSLVAATGCRPEVPARTVVLSLPYDLDSLEPGLRDRLSDFAILSNLYEPLVTTDAHLAVHPCLAERWENPDMTTWVFHLRKGVRFHDGREMTAVDVVYSFQRLFGERDLEARRHILTIQSVRPLAPDRVEIRTRTPLADFLNRIRFIHVVPAGAERATLRTAAVGTGPYRLDAHVPRREVALRRHDEYWGPRPAVGRAVIRLNRQADDALTDLAAGRADLVQANSPEAAGMGTKPGVAVRRISSIAVKLLFLDVTRERTAHVTGGKNPFRDRRVREAIHVALDRARLARRLASPALPAYQLVPPFIFGYHAGLPPVVPDPARARSLLAEAGYPGGFEATLHARQILADGAVALRDSLEEVGIRLNVRSLPEEEFFETTRVQGDFALALTRFGCPTGDAANFLDAGLHTFDPSRGYGQANAGGYSNPEVDRLIEESGRTLDPPPRRRTLERVMEVAMRDLPWIPLYVDEDVYVHRAGLAFEPRLDNYVIVSEIGLP